MDHKKMQWAMYQLRNRSELAPIYHIIEDYVLEKCGHLALAVIALEDISKETGTPYARIADEALARINKEPMKSYRGTVGEEQDGLIGLDTKRECRGVEGILIMLEESPSGQS